MLKMLVDRCHVADTNRAVIRYVISRLKRGYQGWQAMDRAKRRAVMTECFRIHRENRALYRSVMAGTYHQED